MKPKTTTKEVRRGDVFDDDDDEESDVKRV